MVGNLDPFQY